MIPRKNSKDLGKYLRDVMQMRRCRDIHFETHSAGAMTVVLCGLLLTACMHAAPPMRADSIGSDRSGNELIRPGANVTIKVYRAGDISPRATGIVDAQDIAEHMQARIVSVSAPTKGSTPSTPALPNANSGMPSPHCTVYGCIW